MGASPSSTSANSGQHIAIVGGGMVGISLALMLAKVRDEVSASHSGNTTTNTDQQSKRPLKITLIEKFPFPKTPDSHIPQPSFDARSTALSAGSVKMLQALGLWADLSAYAEPINTIHISDRGHFNSTEIQGGDYGVDALGYVIENQHFGYHLFKHLLAADIECLVPATVTHCQMKRQGVELHIEHADTADSSQEQQRRSTLEADLVLVADGAHSALSKSLGIESQATDYGQSAIITNIALAKPHNHVAYERFTEQGPLALLPLPDFIDEATGVTTYRAAVVWTRHHQDAQALMALDDDAFLQSLQACFGYRADCFLGVGKRQSKPLQLVEAQEQVRSHIALLGNAAHFLHPVAGQGFNLSLRDVQAMVNVLREAHIGDRSIGAYATLKTYLEQREGDQALTTGITHALVKVFSNEQWILSVSRQLGLMGLQALPVAKQTLARQMMGVM